MFHSFHWFILYRHSYSLFIRNLTLKKDVYTIPEAAKICSVGRTTMWRWVKSGEFKASITLGGKYRISKADLENFIIKNNIYPLVHKHSPLGKILIVDDDPDIQTLFTKILFAEKYKTEIASDGFEAGIKVMEFKPDLIILDLFMPGMDGFDVCERIKKNSSTSHIKILAVTGYDTTENKNRIMQAGADGYLAKPMGKNKLVNIIKELLR